MADIRCPNCGKDNPDFLDVCQFCQTPLTNDSMLQIGQSPTKKNTGELESILPEWLRDVRKQGRESAEEGELPSSSTQPRIQKNEAPDLLAGLASQGDDDEDDIPDWLSSINPVAKPKPSVSSKPEPSNDFFAQFNIEPEPEKGGAPQKEEETPPAPSDPTASAPEPPVKKDELSEWLTGASKEPSEPFAFQPDTSHDVADWMGSLGTSEPASQAASEEKEDLSWLHDLEASANQPGSSSQPKQSADWNFNAPSAPSSSQSSQGEDLSWLNALGGMPAEPAQPTPSKPSQKEDLSWLDNLGGTSTPSQPTASQPSKQEDLSWLNDLGGISESANPASSQPAPKEDLSWLDNLGGPSTTAPKSPSQPSQKEDLSWLNDLGGTAEPAQPSTSQSASSDDLSWLNNIGQTAENAQPASSQEDLSWLNNLGATAEPAQPASTEDLGWLDSLGGVAEPVQPPTTSASVPSSQDDLSWLNNFGGTAEPASQATIPSASGDLDWLGQLGETPTSEEPLPTPSSSEDELDWLRNFAASTSEPSQPASSESIDMGWLDTLGSAAEPTQATPVEPTTSDSGLDWLTGLGETPSVPGQISARPFGTTNELNPPKGMEDGSPISPFMPRRTAPLHGEPLKDDMPDWLRSATQETPNLPLGAGAFEQFRETPRKPFDETPPSTPEPDTIGSNVIPSSTRSLSSQDVDSLFSVDLPDWLSKPEPEASGIPAQKAEAPIRDESLAPVELPSWVQAMRPVESVLAESGASIENQPTEKEGPLAGLRGVIPTAPIGSSRRPKAISLKLQASEEQQAGASLFDQILAGETVARTLEQVSSVTSQNMLRWVISGILIVVLSAVLLMRSQMMPVSAELPLDVSAATGAINAIPNNSSVLVVVDYEPSLAGEMEAVGAPVLNQIVLAHQPKLVFLATSPESVGLIERLLTNARITDGFAYTLGNQYFNMGYLPGGTAGIQGFTEQPNRVIPSATAQNFADYSAVILLTDHAESGRAWVEQLDVKKQSDPSLANQSLILLTSAQTGPLLQPYVSSKQAAGMVNGLADAARFEYANALPSANWIARIYWDAFGFGILLAVVLIIIGSAWSLVSGFRARRVSGEQG